MDLPLAGTAWTYSLTDHHSSRRNAIVTVRVLRASRGSVEEQVFSTLAPGEQTRVVNGYELAFLHYAPRPGVEVIELAPYLLAPYCATEGETLKGEVSATGYPLGAETQSGWVTSVQSIGWEQIEVPAGKFGALRIEIAGQRERHVITQHPMTGSFRLVAWYSPQVRRTVRQEHRSWATSWQGGAQNAHQTFELLIYDPPS